MGRPSPVTDEDREIIIEIISLRNWQMSLARARIKTLKAEVSRNRSANSNREIASKFECSKSLVDNLSLLAWRDD